MCKGPELGIGPICHELSLLPLNSRAMKGSWVEPPAPWGPPVIRAVVYRTRHGSSQILRFEC